MTALLAALAVLAATPAPLAGGIDGHRWHRRILLVFAPSASPQLADQRAIVRAAADGFRERDLVVVEVAGARVAGASEPAAMLRRRYRVPEQAFRVVLVGKDGGTKLSATQPLAADRLFVAIDAMPMRRAELAR